MILFNLFLLQEIEHSCKSKADILIIGERSVLWFLGSETGKVCLEKINHAIVEGFPRFEVKRRENSSPCGVAA